MNTQAIIMFWIGAVGLWGGLSYFLWRAYQAGPHKKVR